MKFLISMMAVLCLSSSSFAQFPTPLPQPGNMTVLANATTAKSNASAAITMASSTQTTLTFAICQFPDHWAYFNTNILFNQNLTNAQVVSAMGVCVDIDNALADADAERLLGNPLLIQATQTWFTGDTQFKNGQYAFATTSFDFAKSDAIAANGHFVAGMLALEDASDGFSLLLLFR